MTQFDKFSSGARAALRLARDAAVLLNHETVGTEHLLLGLVDEADDLAAFVLHLLEVSPKGALADVVTIFGKRDEPFTGKRELTQHAKAAIETAIGESLKRGHVEVGTIHLLLGILSLPESGASRVLHVRNIDPVELRDDIIALYEPATGGMAAGPALERLTRAKLEENTRERSPDMAKLVDDDLSAGTIAILLEARSEARRCFHRDVGTDHLLLALIEHRGSLAANVLTGMGLTVKRVRLACRFVRGPRKTTRARDTAHLPVSAGAHRVIERARLEARQLRSLSSDTSHLRFAGRPLKRAAIDPGHLLLGLIAESGEPGVAILESYGLDLDEVRRRVLSHVRYQATVHKQERREPGSLWEWLNQQLIRREWSLTELATRTGLSKRRIRGWVAGAARPSAVSCDALAKALDTDPDIVRKLAGRPPAPQPDTRPERIATMRELFGNVSWSDDRIERMTALLRMMMENDQS